MTASDFSGSPCVVVTSISPPNDALREIAARCKERSYQFYLIGDVKSPAEFALDGCDFYSLERQKDLDFETAELLPLRHYARKNIGYLLAIKGRSQQLLETDDDNMPREAFWAPRNRILRTKLVSEVGWVNAYAYFTTERIWPRGLPLDADKESPVPFESIAMAETDCPIQQGLANDDPDIDAIYRLLFPLPIRFMDDRDIAFGKNAWSPFNSQSTAWFPEAYPLLYLPSYCSMRLTDIWRGFVAQRIAWENNWSILFRSPDVFQVRNVHNLMRDFADEIPGYLHNRTIAERLSELNLKSGQSHIGDNLLKCYEELIAMKLIPEQELRLIEAWLRDLSQLKAISQSATGVTLSN
jgi:hypothetical protein